MKRLYFFLGLSFYCSQIHALHYPIDAHQMLKSQENAVTVSTEDLDFLVERSLASQCAIWSSDAKTWKDYLKGFWFGSFPTTGFFITPRGHLLMSKEAALKLGTHNFKIFIKFSDESLPAKLVALHPTADIALLKMETPDLQNYPHLQLSSEPEKVGNWVFSLRGVGISRETKRLVCYPTLGKIMANESDMTVSFSNIMNEGSPILNLEGKVVGIVSWIDLEEMEDIGDIDPLEALPINSVKNWIDSVLKADGYLEGAK